MPFTFGEARQKRQTKALAHFKKLNVLKCGGYIFSRENVYSQQQCSLTARFSKEARIHELNLQTTEYTCQVLNFRTIGVKFHTTFSNP